MAASLSLQGSVAHTAVFQLKSRDSQPSAVQLALGAGRRLETMRHERNRSLSGTSLQLESRSSHGVQHGRARPLKCTSSTQSGSAGEMTVAITGATGFVGTRLVQTLLEGGHKVKVLTRSASSATSAFPGKSAQIEVVEPPGWAAALKGCTGVVNLAGTPISTRWTQEVKVDIKKSRIDTTTKVVNAINALKEKERPSVFVSSSALGFYGTSISESFDESSTVGSDYLAEVCQQWEAAALKAESVRVVLLRTGIVLDKEGGALAKMVPIFKLFAGGPVGSGKQWFSWVHRDDLVGLILEALHNPAYKGAINGIAPNPVRFEEMCERLGKTIGRPSWLPVPEFAVRALLGDGASVVLDGQKVLPKRAQELGFTFKYKYISDALSAIFSK